MDKEFKEPILSAIYRIWGFLIVFAGIVFAVLAAAGRPVIEGTEGITGIILTLLIAVAVALPFFGIAQFFNYVGKIAFYAESINENLNLSTHVIHKSTKEISEQVKILTEQTVEPDSETEQENSGDSSANQ